MEIPVEASRIDIGDWSFPDFDGVFMPGLLQKTFSDALGASLENDPPSIQFSDWGECDHPMEVSVALPFQQCGGYVWLEFRLDEFLIKEACNLDNERKLAIAKELRKIADVLDV
jgi:hypothetical protein